MQSSNAAADIEEMARVGDAEAAAQDFSQQIRFRLHEEIMRQSREIDRGLNGLPVIAVVGVKKLGQ